MILFRSSGKEARVDLGLPLTGLGRRMGGVEESASMMVLGHWTTTIGGHGGGTCASRRKETRIAGGRERHYGQWKARMGCGPGGDCLAVAASGNGGSPVPRQEQQQKRGDT